MPRPVTCSVLLAAVALLAAACGEDEAGTRAEATPPAEDRDVIRFGVGPVLPTPEETREAFGPFFAHLAEELGYDDFELAETTEWAGVGVALASEQVDVAWLGPWGYVLARDANPDVEAVSTVLYEDRPTYTALLLTAGDADLVVPDDLEGASLSLADTGSTSGWLMPTFQLQEWGIDDPEEHFSEFNEGATHAANVISVVEGTVDVASDFDRHLEAMFDEGRVGREDVRVVWESDPLPNDAIAVRPGLDRVGDELLEALVGMPTEEATELLPDRYTGFVEADHEGYALVEEAGVAVGRIDGADD